MGLAGTKVKQRFGLDPRNTNWSNDTDRFGHQYLEKMGWQPGKGLGLVDHAMTSHVKVSIKTDNTGLGSKLAKKRKNDEFDSGECAGLDVFQRILGRLNGKEEQINNELERQRKEGIINGKWGMHFVRGDVLKSTWNAECKQLMQSEKRKVEESEPPRKKAKKLDDKADKEEKKSKKSKKLDKQDSEKKSKKDKSKKDKSDKGKKNKSEKEKVSDGESKSLKKDKFKDKKEKSKDKKEKKSKDKKEKSKDKKEKSKDKKEKSAEVEEVTRESMLKPREQVKEEIATRLSARAKWIRQKRASVMDAKALNEIFMIAN